MENTTISEIQTEVTELNNDDLFLVSKKNGESYTSAKITSEKLKNSIKIDIPEISVGYPDYSNYQNINNKIFIRNNTPIYDQQTGTITINDDSFIGDCDEYVIQNNGYLLLRLALTSTANNGFNTSLYIKNSINDTNWFIAMHWHQHKGLTYVSNVTHDETGKPVITTNDVVNYLCDAQYIPIRKGNVVKFTIARGTRGTIEIGSDEGDTSSRGALFIAYKN